MGPSGRQEAGEGGRDPREARSGLVCVSHNTLVMRQKLCFSSTNKQPQTHLRRRGKLLAIMTLTTGLASIRVDLLTVELQAFLPTWQKAQCFFFLTKMGKGCCVLITILSPTTRIRQSSQLFVLAEPDSVLSTRPVGIVEVKSSFCET